VFDSYLWTVAHEFAKYRPEWKINNKKIESLQDKDNESVAHLLAVYNSNWITKDPAILNLTTNYGATVGSFLLKRVIKKKN
jgi:hypothetical protein